MSNILMLNQYLGSGRMSATFSSAPKTRRDSVFSLNTQTNMKCLRDAFTFPRILITTVALCVELKLVISTSNGNNFKNVVKWTQPLFSANKKKRIS